MRPMPPARWLMDHFLHGFDDVVSARWSARVDQTDASHVFVQNLVAPQIDGMVGCKVCDNAFLELATATIGQSRCFAAAVIVRKLPLDTIRADGSPQMVGPLRSPMQVINPASF
jgi:hypothetical protein